jgi:hypothetical protein
LKEKEEKRQMVRPWAEPAALAALPYGYKAKPAKDAEQHFDFLSRDLEPGKL